MDLEPTYEGRKSNGLIIMVHRTYSFLTEP
jgi:hypothetical protein